jgi:transcriptional regulator NrdR family protein
MQKVWVIKANGEREIFDETKLRDSLRRSGADEDTVNLVVDKITFELRDGLHTQKIYSHAFSLFN